MNKKSMSVGIMSIFLAVTMGLGAEAMACGFKGAVGFAGPDMAKMQRADGQVNVLVYKKDGDQAGSKLLSNQTLAMLSKMGYTVATMDKEADAVAAAKSGKFQVVIASLDDARIMQGTGAKVVAYSQTLEDSQRAQASEYAAIVTTEGASSVLSLVTALKKAI